MFCDLVGSTALSRRLDPEDLREVIGAYHRCVGAAVRRFDGFVAKYMGDGVLVYFGYPRADEHDAERAVRGGLALVEGVAGLDTAAGEALQVRVGIASGLVVVGDLIGAGEFLVRLRPKPRSRRISSACRRRALGWHSAETAGQP
jgi:class 3 adenylate cyclase